MVRRKQIWDRPLVWVLPCVIFMLALVIFPLLYSLVLSFCKWDISSIGGLIFVRLGNYKEILMDYRFRIDLRNTLLMVIGASSLEMLLGMLSALLLARELRGKAVFRTIVILPMMMMPIVVGSIWKTLFHFQAGPVNQWLTLLGLPGVQWLMRFPEGIMSIIIADVWQWTPFVALVLLAGLQSLPQEPFESARVDGASEWKIFRYLTLPLLKPILITILLLRVIDIFKIFDTVFVLTGGGPGISTESLALSVYTTGLRDFRIGYASALSYILVVIVSVLTSFFFKYTDIEARFEGKGEKGERA